MVMTMNTKNFILCIEVGCCRSSRYDIFNNYISGILRTGLLLRSFVTLSVVTTSLLWDPAAPLELLLRVH
jgi:hypothetical protein